MMARECGPFDCASGKAGLDGYAFEGNWQADEIVTLQLTE